MYVHIYVYVYLYRCFPLIWVFCPSIHPSLFINSTFIKSLLCAKTCAKSWATAINTTISRLSILELPQISLGEGHMKNHYHPAWRGKWIYTYGVKMVSACAERCGTGHLLKRRETWSDPLLRDSMDKAWEQPACAWCMPWKSLLHYWWINDESWGRWGGEFLRLWDEGVKCRVPYTMLRSVDSSDQWSSEHIPKWPKDSSQPSPSHEPPWTAFRSSWWWWVKRQRTQ